MSSFRFELDAQGVKKNILQADWMRTYIETQAKGQMNESQIARTFIGFDRAKTIIYPKRRRKKKDDRNNS